MSSYLELETATNFSFLEGASHAEELVDQARDLKHAGIGIADRNTLAGVVPTTRSSTSRRLTKVSSC